LSSAVFARQEVFCDASPVEGSEVQGSRLEVRVYFKSGGVAFPKGGKDKCSLLLKGNRPKERHVLTDKALRGIMEVIVLYTNIATPTKRLSEGW